MTQPGHKFSPDEVRQIRQESDAGILRVRAWADRFGCSPETVRKVARRDTYREVAEFGQRATISGRIPSTIPALSNVPKAGFDEPSEEEIAASFARLRLAKPPLDADEALDELMERRK